MGLKAYFVGVLSFARWRAKRGDRLLQNERPPNDVQGPTATDWNVASDKS